MQWAKNFSGDVHIVYYDDLVDNVDGTLRDILHFLNFPIDQVGIVHYSRCATFHSGTTKYVY